MDEPLYTLVLARFPLAAEPLSRIAYAKNPADYITIFGEGVMSFTALGNIGENAANSFQCGELP